MMIKYKEPCFGLCWFVVVVVLCFVLYYVCVVLCYIVLSCVVVCCGVLRVFAFWCVVMGCVGVVLT